MGKKCLTHERLSNPKNFFTGWTLLQFKTATHRRFLETLLEMTSNPVRASRELRGHRYNKTD